MSMFTIQVCETSPEDMVMLQGISEYCETLRPMAENNTGSISMAAMVYLRELCVQFKPKVIVEVGTFIGKSTLTMAFGLNTEVYTCDQFNGCLFEFPTIHTHSKQSSTQMLGKLVDAQVKADFFFFDGRLHASDVALILRLSKWNTVYAFDDYDAVPTDPRFTSGKGLANVALLEPFLKDYTLIEPPDKVADIEGETTIAVLMPRELV